MSTPIRPIEYWRQAKKWHDWVGKTGQVVVSTVIRVAPPELADQTPYSFVLVDFDGQKKELMGVGHDTFQPGDRVKCVLRKLGQPSPDGIVPYGLKVEKLHD